MIKLSKEFEIKNMQIRYWGEYNHFNKLCENNIISQNILQSCYNKALTIEDISERMGVAIPYISRELEILSKYGLIKKIDEMYRTTIVILYKEQFEEYQQLYPIQKEMASQVINFINENNSKLADILDINNVPLYLRWYASTLIAKIGVLDKFQLKSDLVAPLSMVGDRGFVWAEEQYQENSFGEINMCNIINDNNDAMFFLDYSVLGEKLNTYFYRNHYDDILFEIANNEPKKLGAFSKRDIKDIQNMSAIGMIKFENGKIGVNIPVYSKQQYFNIQTFLMGITTDVAYYAEKITNIIHEFLLSVTPSDLSDRIKEISALQMFNTVIAPLFKVMIDDDFLTIKNVSNILTSYIVLSK